MKTTGIVRPLDRLGRLVLPIELRRTMGIAPKDELEIFADGDTIVLKKYQPRCVFCGGTDRLSAFQEKSVCDRCLEKLREIDPQ